MSRLEKGTEECARLFVVVSYFVGLVYVDTFSIDYYNSFTDSLVKHLARHDQDDKSVLKWCTLLMHPQSISQTDILNYTLRVSRVQIRCDNCGRVIIL